MPLRDLGFTAFQERLYLMLLPDPDTDLVRLAEQLQATDDELRAGLDALADLSVIRFGPAGIVVPHPSLVLGRLIERREDALMSDYRRVSDVRSEIAGLEGGYGSATSGPADAPTIERVEGMEAVRDRIEELSFFSRVSLDSIQPGGPQSRQAIEASRPLDSRAARRKIAMRLIHERAVLDDDANRAHLHELVGLGVQVRVTDRPVERMLIFDGEIAVVPIEPGNSKRGALVVRQPSLVVGLADLFSRTWDEADELELDGAPAAAEEPGAALSEPDLKLLALLAAGATDEAVARELGVSVRHLRRRLSRILAALGASSRFEAGAEAARRGWL